MITVGAFGGILLLMQLLNDYFQFYEDISAGLERRYFSSFSRMLTHIVLGYACIMYVNGISSKINDGFRNIHNNNIDTLCDYENKMDRDFKFIVLNNNHKPGRSQFVDTILSW